MPRLRPEPKSVEELALERSKDPQPGPTLEEVKQEYGGLFESKEGPPPADGPVAVDKKVYGKDEILAVDTAIQEPDEATLALQKQIADLKKSEEMQRRLAWEYEEKLRQAQDQHRRTTEENEELIVGTGLAAATEKVERFKIAANNALLELRAAKDAGDTAAEIEAQDKLLSAKVWQSRAEEEVEKFKLGKEEAEQRKKEPPKLVEARQSTGDPIDGYDLPSSAKDWLRAHREYVTDQYKADELGLIHRRAERKGLRPGMPDYLPFIENGLREIGSLPKLEESNDEPAPEPDRRASIVSAPVSREAPSGGTGQRASTKIRLTAEEQEYARISGITDVEYARQKQKLSQEKANGNYGERR